MAPIQQMVHRNWLFLLAITLLLFFPAHVRTEPPGAEELFQRMSQSYQTVDFEGQLTFISQVPGEPPVREARIIRKAPDKQRIEFIGPSEMRGMGMVMNKGERWRLRSERSRERRPFLFQPPSRMTDRFLPKNTRLLFRNYDVRILDGGSVAGRDTYLIELEPKTIGKPSRKIWVDAEMGVILKMENYDSQKRLKDLFAFSEINFKPEIDEAAFRSRHKPEERRGPRGKPGREELWKFGDEKPDLGKIRKKAELDVILPDRPLAGFVLQSIQAIKLGERKNVHLKYTDGLSVLSVFQSPDGRGRRRGPGSGPPGREGKSKMINIGGVECEVVSGGGMSIFRWNRRGVLFILMGELGHKQMAGIAGSFIGEGK